MRTEATHKHARTHREAKSKMHSDHIYPEGQTREDAQIPAEAYTDNPKQQACSGTHHHKERSIYSHIYPELGACTHPT